jgi:hypothetical protein
MRHELVHPGAGHRVGQAGLEGLDPLYQVEI